MTIALRPPALVGGFRPLVDRSQSPEGKRLSELWEQVSEHAEVTGRAAKAQAALQTAVAGALEADWDGYGARPVTRGAYERGKAFLELLPVVAPVPAIGVIPDGGISFEWGELPTWTFSVVVRSGAMLTYAGLFGVNKAHGTELFFDDEIPKTILDNLSRILSETR